MSAHSRPQLACALLATVVVLSQPGRAQAAELSAAERVAIFKAAGATMQNDGRWLICADDPQTAGASIDEVRDLNGDGRPEAVVNEDGTYCNGMAGTRFAG